MRGLSIAAMILVGLTSVNSAQERDRLKMADKYKWNLADIYPNNDAWRTAKDAVARQIPSMHQYQGKLASSAGTLTEALDKLYSIDKELSRLFTYAVLSSDQDTRDSKYQGMREEMTQMAAGFGAEVSFVEPEILKTGKPTIDKFLASEPRLKTYRFRLEDIVRRAPHTLTDSEEKILADAGVLASGPSNIYGILSNADFPYPTVTLSDGQQA